MQVDGGGWMVSTLGSGGNLIKTRSTLTVARSGLNQIGVGATFIFRKSWFESGDEPLILIA